MILLQGYESPIYWRTPSSRISYPSPKGVNSSFKTTRFNVVTRFNVATRYASPLIGVCSSLPLGGVGSLDGVP